MGDARDIGRVGALAMMLGVGSALAFGSPLAGADAASGSGTDPGRTSSPTGSAGRSPASSSRSGSTDAFSAASRPAVRFQVDGGGSGGIEIISPPDHLTDTSALHGAARITDAPDTRQHRRRASGSSRSTNRGVTLLGQPERSTDAPRNLQAGTGGWSGIAEVKPDESPREPSAAVASAVVATISQPVAASVARPATVVGNLLDVLGFDPVSGGRPVTPVQAPLLFTVLAWVRREFEASLQSVPSSLTASSSATLSAKDVEPSVPLPAAATSNAVAASPVINSALTAAYSIRAILRYTFFNTAPSADPVQSVGQSATGVVIGNLDARSPSGAALTYVLAQAPARGIVEIGQDGAYTYTPDADLAETGGIDSFTVTIESVSSYRLPGLAGAIQGLLHSLARAIGLSESDTAKVAVPVTIAPPGESSQQATNPTVGFSLRDSDSQIHGVEEGDSGTTIAMIPVGLSSPSYDPITVYYKVGKPVWGSATPGEDFLAEAGSIEFAPGQTRATLPVTIYGDTTYEAKEYLFITLTGANGADLAGGVWGKERSLDIINDDEASATTVGFQTDKMFVTEGDSGTTSVPVAVGLSGPATEPITVDYEVGRPSWGNATPDKDFLAESGTLEFAPGQTEAILTATVYGDTIYEKTGSGLFFITLSNPTGAQLVKDHAEGSRVSMFEVHIVDDDPAPVSV